MAEWISVEDRLPEDIQSVLVTDGLEVTIGWWRSLKYEWDVSLYDPGDVVDDTVTHWQPLPSPPEQVGSRETPQSEPHDWDDSFGRTPEKKMSREELYGQDES